MFEDAAQFNAPAHDYGEGMDEYGDESYGSEMDDAEMENDPSSKP